MAKGLGNIVAGSLLKAGGETIVEDGKRKREAALKSLEKADAKELATFKHGMDMSKQAAADEAANIRQSDRLASDQTMQTERIDAATALEGLRDENAAKRAKAENKLKIAFEQWKVDNAPKGSLTDAQQAKFLTDMFAETDFDGNQTLSDENKQRIAATLTEAKSPELKELGGALSKMLFPTPNAKQIDGLIMNPEKAAEFNSKFGPKASEAYIGKR